MKRLRSYVAIIMSSLMIMAAVPAQISYANTDNVQVQDEEITEKINIDEVGTDYVKLSWASQPGDHPFLSSGDGVQYYGYVYDAENGKCIKQFGAEFTGTEIINLESGTSYKIIVNRAEVHRFHNSIITEVGTVWVTTVAE